MSTKAQFFTTLGATGRTGEVVNPAMGGQVPIAIPLSLFRHGSGIGLLVNIADGSSADYDIEVSGNDLSESNDLKAWNKHDVVKAKTSSANGNLAYPVTAVRLFFRSLNGLVTFAVVYPDI